MKLMEYIARELREKLGEGLGEELRKSLLDGIEKMMEHALREQEIEIEKLRSNFERLERRLALEKRINLLQKELEEVEHALTVLHHERDTIRLPIKSRRGQ